VVKDGEQTDCSNEVNSNRKIEEYYNTKNPLLPLEYHIPDCEAHVMSDGRLYLYGSYDKEEDKFCSTKYYVISTGDMKCWTIHDVAFRSNQAHWANKEPLEKPSRFDNVKSIDELPEYIKEALPKEAKDLPITTIIEGIKKSTKDAFPKETYLYAPDAIEHHGKYFLYMCLSDESEGVAVSDNPFGPFTSAKKIPVVGIDPSVFIDDDGQGYYYWGQFNCSGALLNSDMETLDTDAIKQNILTEHEHFFHEGSSIRKIGDKYYMIFSDISRGKPTSLGYAISKSPLGPFKYMGVIIDNNGCDPKSWNNHGSIEKFNGQWYVFYHRSSRNSNSMRRVCAEPIIIKENGEIDEVKMTSQGIGEPFKSDEYIPAYRACEVSGKAYIGVYIDTEAIYSIAKGDSVIFRYIEFQHNNHKIWLDVKGEGDVSIYVNNKLCGTGNLSDTEIQLSSLSGIFEIKIVFNTVSEIMLKGIMLIK